MRALLTPTLCILGVIAAGCARTQKFKVIDAETGQPIAGVHVTRFGYGTEVFAGAREQNAALPETGPDGITTAKHLDACEMHHSFRFSRGDYSEALAELLLPEAEVSVVSPNIVGAKANWAYAGPVITIPMHRTDSSSTPASATRPMQK